MKGFIFAVAVAAISSASIAAESTDKRYLALSHGEGAAVLIDTKSVVKQGGFSVAWTVVVRSDKDSRKDFDYIKLQSRFDCLRRTNSQEYILAYRDDERIAGGEGDHEVTPIVPGSQGELAFNYVCEGKEPAEKFFFSDADIPLIQTIVDAF